MSAQSRADRPQAAAQPQGEDVRILFFSGGSAINPVACRLKRHTAASIHLVTPFDSGGSSGSLRRRFRMPAVGDLRSRMLALCDESDPQARAMGEVLGFRFPDSADPLPLGRQLLAGVEQQLARHPCLDGAACATELLVLLESLEREADFDLRGASLGNLALTAAYLSNGRTLRAAAARIGRWLKLRGQVRCTVEDDLQLAVRLRDGRTLLGQHRITGKERPPLDSPIERIWLAAAGTPEQPADCAIAPDIVELIRSADLLVYAPGSFFSSLLVHFLPRGVGAAIAASAAPKVYVPNLGRDPELLGHAPAAALALLLRQLDAPQDASDRLVTHVLVDHARAGDFPALPQGLQLQTAALQATQDGRHDPDPLARALLRLARRPARL